jgi:tripartite-type tricarboxylate transporter receptor subunit TctC
LARGRLDRAAPSLSPPRSRPPPGHKRDTNFSSHCCGCRFSAALKPYRGTTPALTALLAGQAQVMFDVTPSSTPHIKAGRLRALAVTTAMRADVLPEVPVMGDFVPGYEASAWLGFGAPKDTPAAVIDTLNIEVNACLADPMIKARFADLGATVLPGSPAEFGKLIAHDTEKWAKVIRAANIKPE